MLTHGTPSITPAIADALVFKDRDLFLLTEPDGRMPRQRVHGLGLYYHDCRYRRTLRFDRDGDARDASTNVQVVALQGDLEVRIEQTQPSEPAIAAL